MTRSQPPSPPLGAPSPPRGEKEGRGGYGSWEASFRFCARIGTMNHPLTRPPATLSPVGGEARGEGQVYGEDRLAVSALERHDSYSRFNSSSEKSGDLQ